MGKAKKLYRRTEYQIVLHRKRGVFRFVLRSYRSRAVAEREKTRLWRQYHWRWLKVEPVVVLTDQPSPEEAIHEREE
jgi:hypothetical protein